MSEMRPNVTSKVAVTILYPKSTQSRYSNEEKGSTAIHLKIAGSAISTMVISIEAINVPSVVFERTTHLYCTLITC